MRIESVEGAARAVRALGLAEPRIVTSGNFASPATLLAAVLAELPAARLHALNAQRDPCCTTASCRRRRSWVRASAGTRAWPTSRAGSRWCRASSTGRWRPTSSSCTPPRRGTAGCPWARGQRPAGRHRGRPRPRGAGHRPAQPADAVDLRRRGGATLDAVDLGRGGRRLPGDPPARDPGRDARLIGELVAARIGTGPPLQAGIGEVPDATHRRAARPARAAGVDRDVQRRRAGPGAGGVRWTADVPLATSFVFGSQELYAWVDATRGCGCCAPR